MGPSPASRRQPVEQLIELAFEVVDLALPKPVGSPTSAGGSSGGGCPARTARQRVGSKGLSSAFTNGQLDGLRGQKLRFTRAIFSACFG